MSGGRALLAYIGIVVALLMITIMRDHGL